MILEGHAIKITNLENFKDLLIPGVYEQAKFHIIENPEDIYYCYYDTSIDRIDYAAEWWIKERVNMKFIIHESLQDYYNYINSIINYTDI